MIERMSPKTLLWCVVLGALAYVLMPFDLIPDLFGPFGVIDDLALIALGIWFYRRHVQQHGAAESRQQEPTGANAGSGQNRQSHQGAKTFDPYAVLGITPTASSDAIQAAYRARMQEYHPDKVAHLGVELQKLAHEKSQQIQQAYRQLRK